VPDVPGNRYRISSRKHILVFCHPQVVGIQRLAVRCQMCLATDTVPKRLPLLPPLRRLPGPPLSPLPLPAGVLLQIQGVGAHACLRAVCICVYVHGCVCVCVCGGLAHVSEHVSVVPWPLLQNHSRGECCATINHVGHVSTCGL
jgi:hypothetical protein